MSRQCITCDNSEPAPLQALAQSTIKALELEGHNALIPDLEGLTSELRALVSPTASSLGGAASAAAQRTQQRPSPATSEDEDELAGAQTDAEVRNLHAALDDLRRASQRSRRLCV